MSRGSERCPSDCECSGPRSGGCRGNGLEPPCPHENYYGGESCSDCGAKVCLPANHQWECPHYGPDCNGPDCQFSDDHTSCACQKCWPDGIAAGDDRIECSREPRIGSEVADDALLASQLETIRDHQPFGSGIEPKLKESDDPCAGCQERQVCSTGVFIPIGGDLRPVCVHPCDVDDVREWIASANAHMSSEQRAHEVPPTGPELQEPGVHPEALRERNLIANALTTISDAYLPIDIPKDVWEFTGWIAQRIRAGNYSVPEQGDYHRECLGGAETRTRDE